MKGETYLKNLKPSENLYQLLQHLWMERKITFLITLVPSIASCITLLRILKVERGSCQSKTMDNSSQLEKISKITPELLKEAAKKLNLVLTLCLNALLLFLLAV